MLLTYKQRTETDPGFSLVELMVVVLVMGILMGIAAPTLLSTRRVANGTAAESNATQALTNEKAYYSANLAFIDLSGSSGPGSKAAALDPTLPWSGTSTAGLGEVTALAGSVAVGGAFQEGAAGSRGQALLVEAGSRSGECLYIADDEVNASVMILGYAESDNANGCAGNSVMFPSTSPAISAGTAGQHIETGSSVTATDWYAQW